MTGSILLVVFHEQGDKVFLTCLLIFSCLIHRFGKGSVSLVVGKCCDNVGHRNLKNHVHTTFQVESETDFHLTALLEGVRTQINLLVLDRIEVLLTCNLAHSGSLILIMACHKREGEVEYAHKNKHECNKLYNSFVLHFVLIYYFLLLFSVMSALFTQISLQI